MAKVELDCKATGLVGTFAKILHSHKAISDHVLLSVCAGLVIASVGGTGRRGDRA